MFSFLKNIFGKPDKSPVQKEMLKSGDPKQMRTLAGNAKTSPEILYYLAKSEDAEIRKAVALNKSTPVQASTLLAGDRDVDVRVALAARLVELLPDLTPERHSQLYAYAVQALGLLAQDEVFKIRKALSTTLMDYAKAPPAVVNRLARDVEREISEPILRFCVALSDDELVDILGQHPEGWVISAIAGRPMVSDRVSEAVVETGDVSATTILINNSGAKFSIATLQKIIERAKNHPEWHQPIALRKELSFDLARQLSGFVSETILGVLEKRSDFDAATRAGIADVIKRRIDYQRQGAPREAPEAKVERFIKANKLSAEVILDALCWQETDFVFLALAKLSGVHPVIVKKMMNTGAPKPIVALCWKAKLPMRCCVELQKQVGRIPPKELLYAKGGTDYPLGAEEIKWQLEFFGVL